VAFSVDVVEGIVAALVVVAERRWMVSRGLPSITRRKNALLMMNAAKGLNKQEVRQKLVGRRARHLARVMDGARRRHPVETVFSDKWQRAFPDEQLASAPPLPRYESN
jgi:hypothetical protein